MIILLSAAATVQADSDEIDRGTSATVDDTLGYYFYHALPYGSQLTYNPMNVIINGGYGILQIAGYSESDDYERKIFRFPYGEWWGNVWETVGHPMHTISEFGWWRFISTEVIPLSLKERGNQWVPNYFLHGIGAGMQFRATEEWFRYHGFGLPRLWSIGVMAAYHVLSEIVENRGNEELTVDHLADLLIFDPAGMLLFSSDKVCRFFSQTLNLSEWSMQPAVNIRNGNLENMGQFYVARYPVSSAKDWYLMVHFGLHGMAGLGYRWKGGSSLSLTGGFLVEELVRTAEQDTGRVLTAVLTWRAGIFYDRNNSLLASLMVSTVPEYRLRLNVYPGVIRVGPLSPGFFVSGSKEWIIGVGVYYVPLGMAWGK
ncbi:MAG: hypothetical protein JSW49_06750 [candidate division WOR-3 bacterium]|nr:MAG: hypothetical protein JSW49_06750 [candidate division WOR-3 bacterium]